MKKLRIAQIADVWAEVPPKGYGGRELIESYITEELVRQGHEVTLFATGNSQTNARLHSVFEKPYKDLYGHFNWTDISLNVINSRECYKMADSFDIIHTHGLESLLLAPLIKTPVISTYHSSLAPDLPYLAQAVKDSNFISISDAQRVNFKEAHWVATVYHGIDTNQYAYNESEIGEYMLFMATIAPFKGADTGVQTALKIGKPLHIAGDIRPEFKDFYETEVHQYEQGGRVTFLNELALEPKLKEYQHARLLLFPIRWVEGFGLVMTEAMSCGTPVVGYANGSVSEIIKDGVTGFIVNESEENKKGDYIIKKVGIEGLMEAIERIYSMSNQEYLQMRKNCRQHVEENFSVKTMVDRYLQVYEQVISNTL